MTFIIKEEFLMYKTGEKPGIGTYQCISCGTKVSLNDNTDVLPPCPKCDNVYYTKLY